MSKAGHVHPHGMTGPRQRCWDRGWRRRVFRQM